MPLFFIFVIIPMMEILVIAKVGNIIGLPVTALLIVLTATMGASLLKYQGLSAWQRARESLDKDQLPLKEVFDGFCLLVAGALLLTPGFITDTAGFLLFVPQFRSYLRRELKKRGKFEVHPRGPGHAPGRKKPLEGDVLEGEFTVVEEEEIDEERRT